MMCCVYRQTVCVRVACHEESKARAGSPPGSGNLRCRAELSQGQYQTSLCTLPYTVVSHLQSSRSSMKKGSSKKSGIPTCVDTLLCTVSSVWTLSLCSVWTLSFLIYFSQPRSPPDLALSLPRQTLCKQLPHQTLLVPHSTTPSSQSPPLTPPPSFRQSRPRNPPSLSRPTCPSLAEPSLPRLPSWVPQLEVQCSGASSPLLHRLLVTKTAQVRPHTQTYPVCVCVY